MRVRTERPCVYNIKRVYILLYIFSFFISRLESSRDDNNAPRRSYNIIYKKSPRVLRMEEIVYAPYRLGTYYYIILYIIYYNANRAVRIFPRRPKTKRDEKKSYIRPVIGNILLSFRADDPDRAHFDAIRIYTIKYVGPAMCVHCTRLHCAYTVVYHHQTTPRPGDEYVSGQC